MAKTVPAPVGEPHRRRLCLGLAGAACLAGAGGAWAAGATTVVTSSARPGAASGSADAASWQPWPAGRATPPLELPDADGGPWNLALQAGHPVLLNFWASWCEPCRAELPSLAALALQEQGRGLRVVAVNFKEGADTVRRIRSEHGPALAWLRDSYGEAARAWDVRSFPTSVLVGRDGRARWLVRGEVDWMDGGVRQRLATLG